MQETTNVASGLSRTTVPIAGVDLEVFECGSGEPILFLHGAAGVPQASPFLELIGRQRRVIAPSHPGFGRSSLPDWIDSVDDIAHIYLELMDRLDLPRVKLIGCSIGGWIAAELATKSPERIEKMILVGPEGVKVGSRDKLDIPDIFAMSQEQMAKIMFHDPAKARIDYSKLSAEQLTVVARNRETLALLVWEPYMHNPKLKHRLHRVDLPVLFMRGESDGLISADYLAKYSKLVPNGRIETIAAAGHSPQVEQPEAFAAKVLSFFEQGV
jgi:pimeloyl-ACP methyl ester carboxylesterase